MSTSIYRDVMDGKIAPEYLRDYFPAAPTLSGVPVPRSHQRAVRQSLTRLLLTSSLNPLRGDPSVIHFTWQNTMWL